MAGRSSSMSMVAAAQQHRMFAPAALGPHGGEQGVELDEADVIWGASPYSSPVDSSYLRAPPVSTAPSKASAAAKQRGGAVGRDGGGGPASLPVNIPDWSKILGAEYVGSAGAGRWPSDERGDSFFDNDGDCDAGGGRASWVPPHELLLYRDRAAASFSVREGAGRTLKGRDLRRVRNAIWEKTGFQD